MDITLEGILIVIMMVVILYFIVSEYSAFFAPKSSLQYYNSLVGMADSACTSIQTASNVQFSSPQILVFQIYGSQACSSALSPRSYIFSPTSSALSALQGNYDLCYATVSNPTGLGVSSGSQYFFRQTSSGNVNFYLAKNNAFSGLGNLSEANSQLSSNGIEANISSISSIILTAVSSVIPQNYSFSLNQYSNRTVNVQVYFNGYSSCSLSYSDLNGLKSLSFVSPCQQTVNNVTILVTPVSNNPTVYQANITANVNANPSQKILSQQCAALPSLVNEGVISNGTIVCEPMLCGGQSFMLADQSNKPFLGLYGGSYTFLGVQSGVNDLQIVNSYSERLLNISLFSNTVFEANGLPPGILWSVTYNGVEKTSRTNLISFSNSYGNYSFSVPTSTGSVGSGPGVYVPSSSKGYALQGSLVYVNFTLSYS
jgi:hypothetical protein